MGLHCMSCTIGAMLMRLHSKGCRTSLQTSIHRPEDMHHGLHYLHDLHLLGKEHHDDVCHQHFL